MQPEQQQSHDLSNNNLSLSELEKSCQNIMNSNFDCDTKTCFITLMKILDNIIQHPTNPKFRSINVTNPAFHKKVGSVEGSIQFLLSCGFIYDTSNDMNTIMMNTSSSSSSSSFLILLEENENQKHIIQARRLLMMRCIQDLKCKMEELPTYKPPPAPIVLTTSSEKPNQLPTSTSTARNNDAFVFNPYVGQRYDALSAGTGLSLGPDPNYVSKTEMELQKLQEKQKQLESDTKKEQQRQWSAYRPDETISFASNNPTSSNDTDNMDKRATTSSDNTLLMEKLQKQNEESKQRQNGGFTTKAMRDLKKLKKMKIYKNVTITIQFPDGFKIVSSSFVPNDTVEDVISSIYTDCFNTSSWKNYNTSVNIFDLYTTPPRRLLVLSQTLLEQDLVPAAKIFVSWKKNWNEIIPSSLALPVSYDIIRHDLFQKTLTSSSSPSALSFPSGKYLVADDNNDDDNDNNKNDKRKDDDTEKKNNNVKKKISREETLLQRMMGRK